MSGMIELCAADCAAWCGGRWTGDAKAVFSGVETDTRKPLNGKLFVALRGPRFDGHDFVPAAFKAGAAGALVDADRVSGLRCGPLLSAPRGSLRALNDIAGVWRIKTGAKITGITGSAGKTTTREILAHLLSECLCAEVCQTFGNWNNSIGLPKSLLAMPLGTSFGVFEAGSNHPGEIAELAAVMRPDSAIITNIGHAHAEFFHTPKDTAEEKSALISAVPEDGFVVLDTDSPFFDFLRSRAKCRILRVSMKDTAADFFAKSVNPATGEMTVRMYGDPVEYDFRTELAGVHQCRDSLLAIAAAVNLGADIERLRGAFMNFHGAPGRWRQIRRGGVLWIDDSYNANPDSMSAALKTLAGMPGRHLAVLGDMLELGPDEEKFHRHVGMLAASTGVSVLIAVGARSCEWIAAEAEHGGISAVLRAENTDDALNKLREVLSDGDTVLVKGSNSINLCRIFKDET